LGWRLEANIGRGDRILSAARSVIGKSPFAIAEVTVRRLKMDRNRVVNAVPKTTFGEVRLKLVAVVQPG